MPPLLALFISSVFVFIAFWSDRKRTDGSIPELFWPTLWYLTVASRPIGVWLSIWGVSLPGGSNDPTDGSLIERYFFGGLTLIGLRILSRRRFSWGTTLRANPWITALLAFMALSILWSSYPYVSFKRYIKVIGSIVMAMVILTNERPFEAFLTVIRRCLYVHLPMSIICTRYFRDIGVSFNWSGNAESWQGISTSKNTLGQMAMLGVVYFFWEVKRRWHDYKWRNLHILYLLMALYLLKGSPSAVSMTSVVVCVFALIVFLRIQSLRNRPSAARSFVFLVFGSLAALITLILVHSVVHFPEESFFGKIITAFGRDITLTDRTLIWSDVYDAASGNPLLGVGFGGFWIGRVANIPWTMKMSWTLGQGHSGYVDTYLQIGFLGSALFACVVFTTLPRILKTLDEDFDFASFRITLFLTILFVNITETTLLRGDHPMWLLLQVVIWIIPYPVPTHTLVETDSPEERRRADNLDNNESFGDPRF